MLGKFSSMQTCNPPDCILDRFLCNEQKLVAIRSSLFISLALSVARLGAAIKTASPAAALYSTATLSLRGSIGNTIPFLLDRITSRRAKTTHLSRATAQGRQSGAGRPLEAANGPRQSSKEASATTKRFSARGPSANGLDSGW